LSQMESARTSSSYLPRLFEIQPLERAMHDLLPSSVDVDALAVAEELAVGLAPELQAAIWLYVDDLDRSHTISQGIPGPIGAYWHGIMHRREGDFSNAKYWFRQAQPLWTAGPDGSAALRSRMGATLVAPGAIGVARSDEWDPCRFVDQVEAARGANPEELVQMQRKEWMALFNYCAERAGVSK